MAKSDRPGDAPLDAVREAYATSMDALAEHHTSVAGVEAIDLPSERLEATN
jgi:hypothetical protein